VVAISLAMFTAPRAMHVAATRLPVDSETYGGGPEVGLNISPPLARTVAVFIKESPDAVHCVTKSKRV
jgi:hypothetical protein